MDENDVCLCVILVLGKWKLLIEVGTSRKYIVMVLGTVDVELIQDIFSETVLVGKKGNCFATVLVVKKGEVVSVYVDNYLFTVNCSDIVQRIW